MVVRAAYSRGHRLNLPHGDLSDHHGLKEVYIQPFGFGGRLGTGRKDTAPQRECRALVPSGNCNPTAEAPVIVCPDPGLPKGGTRNALSTLRRQTNRSAQDGLPWPQLVSPPAMRPLRVPLQYPRKASALEPCGTEVAGTSPIPEGMEESSEIGTTWELRGRVVRS